MKFIIFLSILTISNGLPIPQSHEWNYGNTRNWEVEYTENCNGLKQSPIDISSPSRLIKTTRSPLEITWENYEKLPIEIIAQNNGHTIQFDPKWKNFDTPFLKYKGNKYVFQQLHFHWGRNDQVGSEHTVNKKRYSLEMHMVHWNKNYGSLNEAINHKDGLIVVASFYEVKENTYSNGLENIIDVAKKLTKVNTIEKLTDPYPFPLSNLEVVKSTGDWVTYEGSLTTPSCNEAVTWMVSLNENSLSKRQMSIIRHVNLNHADSHNYRPTQPLNGRTINWYLQKKQ